MAPHLGGLRSAGAFAGRHVGESVSWLIAAAYAVYAGTTSGQWTAVAVGGVVAVVARWFVGVWLRERRHRQEVREQRARRLRARHSVATAARHLSADTIATRGLVVDGAPPRSLAAVVAEVRAQRPVTFGRIERELFASWSADVSVAAGRFTAATATDVPDLDADDRRLVARMHAAATDASRTMLALAELAGGDLTWSRKDHTQMQFPERVAQIEAEADRLYLGIAGHLGALDDLVAQLIERAQTAD